MRLLLTGMTSQQTNLQSHRKSVNFCGLLWEAFRQNGHEVYWQDPSVNSSVEDLREFDHVIVGVAPLTALGANRAYGALSIIERLWSSPKLKLLVDAPEPMKITTSLQAVLEHPENLTKDFFSYRKEYGLAKSPEVSKRLLEAVRLLHVSGDAWPWTLVPGLPWMSDAEVYQQLPIGAKDRVQFVNLDALLFERYDNPEDRARVHHWAYEKGTKSGWLKSQLLSAPVKELPHTFRVETNSLTIQQLETSIGCLVGAHRSSSWWSPRFAMSLSQRTPVFTDWRATSQLGDVWSTLPSALEVMTDAERRVVAAEQHQTYREHCLSPKNETRRIIDILAGSSRRARRKARNG